MHRLRPIGIGEPSITLLQPVGKRVIYVRGEHALPDGMLETVRTNVAKAAGDDVRVDLLRPDEDLGKATLVAQKGIYRLALVPAHHGPAPLVSTAKEAMRGSPWANAHKASKVFKEGQPPSVNFRLLKFQQGRPRRKAGSWERIVTGVILEPEVADGTRDANFGSDADIYDEHEICKAMYFWMENNFGSFSHHHIEQGGQPLQGGRDVILLENWQQYPERQIGDQVVKAGAWLQTNRVGTTAKGERLWKSILAGHINSWSIGAEAMGMLEEVTGPVTPAGRNA
jgi:hypothetical protein